MQINECQLEEYLMTEPQFPLARAFLTEMWTALAGDRALTDRVTFTGEGSIPGAFAQTDLAGAAFGVAATAVSELMETAGESPADISVDRALATQWFLLPPGPSRLLSAAPGPGKPITLPAFFTELPTADGRWLRLHGGFPSMRKRIVTALGIPEDIDMAAAIVRERNADDIEQELVDADCVVAASRTPEEWFAHPAGVAVDAEPLADVTDHPAAGSTWRPTPGRPLSGIKVLDLTRVVAGPTGTRFLAALGAEVLRIDAPGSDESTRSGLGYDLQLGKRWAFLDLKTPDGLAQFKRLLADADVLVHGYRPGGIDALVSQEERRSINPDLVEVAIRAYGWTGPWQMRRGFDTVVQFSVGLANATQEWALEDRANREPVRINYHLVDASRPRHTPVEGLDLSTGYQMAAAVIRGLTRRLQTGAGSTTNYSLARTASMLIRAGRNPDSPEIPLPVDGPWEKEIYGSPLGPVRRLSFPVTIEGTRLYWERPSEKAGSSSPVWTS
jgi:crotonobetainyl-CoA:carnitine CoA-transferase CaiB-like acyl-CoA transferase